MCKMIYVAGTDEFKHLTGLLKQSDRKFPSGAHYMTLVIKSVFVRYMREFCTDSFAIGIEDVWPTQEDDYAQKKAIYIAFRSEKELFKFIMKIGAKRTRWWKSGLSFTYVGKEDDPFEGHHAGENWNYEDPQDMLQ